MKTIKQSVAALGRKTFEQRIEALERKAAKLGLSGFVHGTTISRALASPEILRKEGLKVSEDPRASTLHWCVAIGGLQQPKQFYRGWTIEEAVRRAERSVSMFAKVVAEKTISKRRVR